MSKKKNRNKASALKQAVKQPAEKPQIKEEEVPDLAGWHMVLFWIKILLIPGYLMNIYVYAKNGIHGTGMYDAAVNAPLLVFLIVSVILHSSRKGVYAFFAFFPPRLSPPKLILGPDLLAFILILSVSLILFLILSPIITPHHVVLMHIFYTLIIHYLHFFVKSVI